MFMTEWVMISGMPPVVYPSSNRVGVFALFPLPRFSEMVSQGYSSATQRPLACEDAWNLSAYKYVSGNLSVV